LVESAAHMRRRTLLLAVLLAAATAGAQEHEDEAIERFYPVLTRRPVVEREVEVRFDHGGARHGTESHVAAALEWVVLPRWQIEVEVPLALFDPRHGAMEAGIGDVEIENKVLAWESPDEDAAVAAGAELEIPTGSARRGTGGDLAVEPFVTAGVALGPIVVLADAAYTFELRPEAEEELHTGLAAGLPLGPVLLPYLELRTRTPTRGDERESEIDLVPGISVHPFDHVTASVGTRLPVTATRDLDYQVLGLVVWEF
jgi:hypothetical protein